MVKKKELDFDSAYQRLKEILNEIQSEDVKIEEMSKLIKEAHELQEFCKNRLRSIEEEINSKETI